jgi:hypothetical protein
MRLLAGKRRPFPRYVFVNYESHLCILVLPQESISKKPEVKAAVRPSLATGKKEKAGQKPGEVCRGTSPLDNLAPSEVYILQSQVLLLPYQGSVVLD